MVEWHHRLNGLEFEQSLGDGEGQGSLACCSSWGLKELDIATEQQQEGETGKRKPERGRRKRAQV